ncbi:MAG: ABC transporter permease, partial [Oscillospiraceae bacterium]|nr:ABC transporter permease [Oscillospiraceae bacterium]
MYKTGLSNERLEYLRRRKFRKQMILGIQLAFVAAVVVLWEVLARAGVIDSFIMSQPSRMLETLIGLCADDLPQHLGVTCLETAVGFLLGTAGGTLLAVLLWWSPFLAKVSEPFLVVLNSLPKIALGPVIIVWAGAGTKAIIVMALAISLIVTVLEMLGGFLRTSREKILMARTFGAQKLQIFAKVVFPSNMPTLFNSLKVNIGLSMVGGIAGEFLVAKARLGYLIVYGGQVFKLDLV